MIACWLACFWEAQSLTEHDPFYFACSDEWWSSNQQKREGRSWKWVGSLHQGFAWQVWQPDVPETLQGRRKGCEGSCLASGCSRFETWGWRSGLRCWWRFSKNHPGTIIIKHFVCFPAIVMCLYSLKDGVYYFIIKLSSFWLVGLNIFGLIKRY